MHNSLEVLCTTLLSLAVVIFIAKKVYNVFFNYQSIAKLESFDPADTSGLVFYILRMIGCQPERDKDGTIYVKYQGENFQIEFGLMCIRIWDPVWTKIKADNPHLPQVRDAVNAANYNFGPAIVLSNPDEEGVIKISTRYDLMLHPSCSYNVQFIKAALDSSFEAKAQFRKILKEIDDKQEESPKKERRPIGFNTDCIKNET